MAFRAKKPPVKPARPNKKPPPLESGRISDRTESDSSDEDPVKESLRNKKALYREYKELFPNGLPDSFFAPQRKKRPIVTESVAPAATQTESIGFSECESPASEGDRSAESENDRSSSSSSGGSGESSDRATLGSYSLEPSRDQESAWASMQEHFKRRKRQRRHRSRQWMRDAAEQLSETEDCPALIPARPSRKIVTVARSRKKPGDPSGRFFRPRSESSDLERPSLEDPVRDRTRTEIYATARSEVGIGVMIFGLYSPTEKLLKISHQTEESQNLTEVRAKLKAAAEAVEHAEKDTRRRYRIVVDLLPLIQGLYSVENSEPGSDFERRYAPFFRRLYTRSRKCGCDWEYRPCYADPEWRKLITEMK